VPRRRARRREPNEIQAGFENLLLRLQRALIRLNKSLNLRSHIQNLSPLLLVQRTGNRPTPYRDFFPIGAQTIKLRLPSGIRAKQARLLVAEKATPISHNGDELILNVASILDHEVVAIEI
jgi:hypothetical protein